MGTKVTVEKSTGMVHVFSTLANPHKFVKYAMPNAEDAAQMGRLPVVERTVLIRGGAGIASKNLITPQGVHTAVSIEEYEQVCLQDPMFKHFVDTGFIRVEKREYDIDKMIGDMNPRDPGGPLTPSDFEASKKDGSEAIPTEAEKLGTGWVANQLNNR